MSDKELTWEIILLLILVALVILTQLTSFSNADISLPALITAILALLVNIAGKHWTSN